MDWSAPHFLLKPSFFCACSPPIFHLIHSDFLFPFCSRVLRILRTYRILFFSILCNVRMLRLLKPRLNELLLCIYTVLKKNYLRKLVDVQWKCSIVFFTSWLSTTSPISLPFQEKKMIMRKSNVVYWWIGWIQRNSFRGNRVLVII